MKKLFSLIFSVALLVSSTVIASAQGVAKFNVNLVSETDKQAVISIDFEGGTGFCALDIDIQINEKRVKVEKAENGKGFENFSSQGGSAFALINKEINPVKGSVVALTPFRVVDGKDLFVLTLTKLSKEALDNDDVKLVVTNCVDGSEKEITPSITTDLQGEQVTEKTTTTANSSTVASSPSNPSEGSSVSQDTADDPTFTNAVKTEAEAPDADDETEAVGEAENLPDDTSANGEIDKTKTVIMIGVLSVVLVVAGIITVIIIKKKNIKETQDEAETEE